MSLRDKAVSGMLWVTLTQGAQNFLQFFVGIALARMLMPEDYGLVALLMVFQLVAKALMDGGFTLAIIQRKNLTDDDVSTVFWFNMGMCLLVYTVIWFTAPLVAAFYREPLLETLWRVSAFGMIFSSLTVCQMSRMERGMQFKRLASIQLPSFIIGAVVGITMAAKGFGPWALIGMALTSNFTSMLHIWIRSRWIPKLVFRTDSFREMFSFGVRTVIERIFNEVSKNLLTLIIGRTYSPVEVGFYNRAKHFRQLSAQNIYTVFNRIMLPTFSSLQDRIPKLRHAFLQTFRLVALVSFPVFAGMAILAEPMVVTLIGEKWLPSVPMLQVMCIGGALLPLSTINVNLMLSQGKSGLCLKLNIWKLSIAWVILWFTYPHGVMAMLWGGTASSMLTFLINGWPMKRLIGVSTLQQLRAIAPYAALTAVMVAAVMLVDPLLGPHHWIRLLGGMATGGIVYLAGLKLMRSPTHREIADMTQKIPVLGKAIKLALT